MLMWMTMVWGLATETWSRPGERQADGYRGWQGDPVRTNELMSIIQKKRTYRGRNYVERPEGPAKYPYQQTLSEQSAQDRYDYEASQQVAPMPVSLTYEERAILRRYAMEYTKNYVFRMIPHAIGIFPYVAVWVVSSRAASHAASHAGDLADSVCFTTGLLQPLPHPAQRPPRRKRAALRSDPRLCAVGGRRHRALLHELHVRSMAIPM